MQLTSLFVHPLKSGRGIEYHRAFASFQGLLHDREWVLIDADGTCITARTVPQMVLIETVLLPGAALFKFPGKEPILAMSTQYHREVEAQIWRDRFVAYHGDSQVDAWFCEALQTPCRLCWLGLKSTRQQIDGPHELSFADGYPYLLLNQASLLDLNQQLKTPVTLRHFRPNLTISGATAFEEDEWKSLRIGEVIFDVTLPCTRCILTTVDPDLGTKNAHDEPLATLQRTRMKDEGICFGVNLVARNEGVLRVGDEMEILETNYEF